MLCAFFSEIIIFNVAKRCESFASLSVQKLSVLNFACIEQGVKVKALPKFGLTGLVSEFYISFFSIGLFFFSV